MLVLIAVLIVLIRLDIYTGITGVSALLDLILIDTVGRYECYYTLIVVCERLIN